MRLRQSLKGDSRERVRSAAKGLPELVGLPIEISVRPQLTAYRGKLLSLDPARGTPVHAASFIRRRQIVLESELLSKRILRLITVHEIFHFVWARLGNGLRRAYTRLVADELSRGARGETGESSAVKKRGLGREAGGPRFRDYVCESFCDTAAWLYSGVRPRDMTLAARWRDRRRAWFEATFSSPRKC